MKPWFVHDLCSEPDTPNKITLMKTNQIWMAAAGFMALVFTSCSGPDYYGENRYYGSGTYVDDDNYYASTYYAAPRGPFYGGYGYNSYDPYYSGIYVSGGGYRHHGDYRRGDGHHGDYSRGDIHRGDQGQRRHSYSSSNRLSNYSGGRTSTRFTSTS
ncbi:MAG: hypothetical protein JWO89_373, partial [Verrucomicrobiaceae bacterium]|nr:hypothetical protein [Verrucomicrobiaceae bacterium]